MRTVELTSLAALLLLIISAGVNAQTTSANAAPTAKLVATPSSSDLIAAATQTRDSNEALRKVQEAAIAADALKLEELRLLVADGLVARVELENAEALLAGLRANLETFKKNIADSEQTIAELRKAEEMTKAIPLLASANSSVTRSFLKPTILRYGGQGTWSLNVLSAVQTFFSSNFGRMLPVSAFGQSATHNRLGYDHRNAVDVALHPDSAEGRALINYLQSQGIPFLAFRAAVAGVATGPHIHIGSPSHRT